MARAGDHQQPKNQTPYSVQIHHKVVERYKKGLESEGLNTSHEVLRSDYSAIRKPNDLLAAWPAKGTGGRQLVFTTLQRRIYNALVFHAKSDYLKRYPTDEAREKALAEDRSLPFTISLPYLHRILEDRTGQYKRTVEAIESLGRIIFNFTSPILANDFNAEEGSVEELLQVRRQMPLLGSVSYYMESQTVKYSIPDELTFMLFSKSSPFTLISLQVNNSLRTKSALALYELILREANMLGVDRLCQYRGPDYYALPMCGYSHRRDDGQLEWAEFKRHALIPALTEINTNPIIPISIDLDPQIRRGARNKVVGIRFKITDRPQMVLDLNESKEELPQPTEFDNLISVGAQFGLTQKGANAWLARNKGLDPSRFSKAYLERIAKEVLKKKLIEQNKPESDFKPCAYFLWSVANNPFEPQESLRPVVRVLSSVGDVGNPRTHADKARYTYCVNELKVMEKIGLGESDLAKSLRAELASLADLQEDPKDPVDTANEAKPQTHNEISAELQRLWQEHRHEFGKGGLIQNKMAKKEELQPGVVVRFFRDFLKSKGLA